MIKYEIKSENPIEHWCHLNVKDKNVLDLGCGLWSIHNLEELTPIYFYRQGAKKIIGVDCSDNDINFLNKNNLDKDKMFFIHEHINSEHQIKDLIKNNDINSIKCDIEGNETLFLNFDFNDFKQIDSFALEYHNSNILQNFLNKYEDWGFKIAAHGKLWVEGVGVLFFEK